MLPSHCVMGRLHTSPPFLYTLPAIHIYHYRKVWFRKWAVQYSEPISGNPRRWVGQTEIIEFFRSEFYRLLNCFCLSCSLPRICRIYRIHFGKKLNCFCLSLPRVPRYRLTVEFYRICRIYSICRRVFLVIFIFKITKNGILHNL